MNADNDTDTTDTRDEAITQPTIDEQKRAIENAQRGEPEGGDDTRGESMRPAADEPAPFEAARVPTDSLTED